MTKHRKLIFEYVARIEKQPSELQLVVDEALGLGLMSKDIDEALAVTCEDLGEFIQTFEGVGLTDKKAEAASFLHTSTRSLDRWLSDPSPAQAQAPIILGYPPKAARELAQAVKTEEAASLLIEHKRRPQSAAAIGMQPSKPSSSTMPQRQEQIMLTTKNISAAAVKKNNKVVVDILMRNGSGNEEAHLAAIVILDKETNVLASDGGLDKIHDEESKGLQLFINSKSFLASVECALKLRSFLSNDANQAKTATGAYRGMMHSTEKWVISSNVVGQIGAEVFVVAFCHQQDFKYGQLRRTMNILFPELDNACDPSA